MQPGEENQDNRLFWEIGGWQNQDSTVCANVNNRNSCLTQSLFAVETDREYRLKLEVFGRTIRTFIDGEIINETVDKLPVIEPLYYSASTENSTGDVIIKVVNVQGKSVTAQLVIKGTNNDVLTGTIFEMSGYNPCDENSFEAPKLVVPRQKDLSVNGKDFSYEFPKQSITIFRLFKD